MDKKLAVSSSTPLWKQQVLEEWIQPAVFSLKVNST